MASAQPQQPSTLVLLSGGLDSAVLLAHEARARRVWPVYVKVGLAWEALELAMVERLLAHPAPAGRASAAVDAWSSPCATSTRRRTGPFAASRPPTTRPDEDVYLTGRNLVLLAKAGVTGRLRSGRSASRSDRWPAIRFPTRGRRSSPRWPNALIDSGWTTPMEVAAPFLEWQKEDVIRRGLELGVPLELTLSCMNPVDGADGPPRHCGLCSKCRERRDAFAAIGRGRPGLRYAAAAPR